MSAGVPVATLCRRYHFSASHRLNTKSLDAERNRAVFGKCNNPHGHGHNYIVEAAFSGPVDVATGMVTNLADLDAFASRELMEVFDQQNLNTLACFSEAVSTTENLVLVVHGIFSKYPHARLVRVHIEETPNNSFDYAGDEAPALG